MSPDLHNVLQRRPRSRGSDRSSLTTFANMRKYYKLIFLVLALVSLACLIFYKTQYDRLYNVLEVMEYFGGEKAPGDDLVAAKSGSSRCSSSSSSPWVPPSFSRVTDDLFVFSSFCQPSLESSLSSSSSSSECAMVVSLALVKRRSLNQTSSLRCKLWYEGTIQPTEGIFFASKLQAPNVEAAAEAATDDDGGQETLAMQLNCESKFANKIPYGISFVVVDRDDESFSHVETTTTTSPEQSSSSFFGACLLLIPPRSSRSSDTTQVLAETVLLNGFFGIKDFLIYDAGFATKRFLDIISEALTEQRSSPLLSSVRLLNFNLPFREKGANNAGMVLAENDCYFRTRKSWQSRTSLWPSQILVPKSSRTLQESIRLGGSSSGQSDVVVHRFCTEFPSEDGSAKNTYSITALEQTVYDKSYVSSSAVKIYGGREFVDVFVNDYAACDKLSFEESESVRDAFVFDLREEIQETVGKFFPHKTV